MVGSRMRWVSGAAIVVAMAGAWVATRGDAETATAPGASDEPADASTTGTPPKVDTTASGGLLFADVAPDAGLTEPQSTELLNFGRAMTGGAAVGDYDDDGVYDLYLTRVGLPNQLYRGNGDGTYEDVTDAAGVAGPDPSGGSAAAVWADVDGDDDLDLFVGGTGTARDAMFINNGDGTFADETARRGLEQPPAPPGPVGSAAFGAAFSDWDQDGDLDLVVTHWNEQALNQFYLKDNQGKDDRLCDAARAPASAAFQAQLDTHPSRARLYRNDGDGNFADATAEMGVDFTRMVGFTPTFADYDDDGWDDLFVTGDFCTSRLFHNDGGTGFSDVTDAAGVGTDEAGMGSVVEDLDGDGHLDWFITAIAADGVEEGCIEALVSVPCSGNRLYLGDGAGSFTDATDEFGVRDGKWAWGAAADDLNNDGLRDLLVVSGYLDIDGQSAMDGQATPDIAVGVRAFQDPGHPPVVRGRRHAMDRRRAAGGFEWHRQGQGAGSIRLRWRWRPSTCWWPTPVRRRTSTATRARTRADGWRCACATTPPPTGGASVPASACGWRASTDR